MNAFKSVTYMTGSPGWFGKMLLGSLFASIPFVKMLSDGYQIETIRNICQGRPYPLPDWSNMPNFRQGFKLRLLVWLMYLPAILVDALAFFLTVYYFFNWFHATLTNADTANITLTQLLLRRALIPVLDILAALCTAVMFFFVPALARRSAEDVSFLSLLNPFPTLGLVLRNFWLYLMGWLTILALVSVFAFIGALIGIVGEAALIGPLIGWFVLCIGRFWGRMVWAYYLGHMTARAGDSPPQLSCRISPPAYASSPCS